MNGLTAKMTTGKPNSEVIFFTESVTIEGNVGTPALSTQEQNGVLLESIMSSHDGITLLPKFLHAKIHSNLF